ncbi:GNAT family N-acetyltransferase [Kribbella sp. NPDC051620]|uniref:GNAT family N-acetyltransferase n=1 Tax=Kribbella sp. NPDC051620 TaxID=3364120 RepID=UPI00379C3CD9
MEIHLHTDASDLAHEIWPIYQEVFGDFDTFDHWRTDLYDRHATRDGYRLVTAVDGPGVVGFGWGYTGQRGQYWSDLVCEALPAAITDEWVGGHFEFVELAVLPAYRGRGVGRALHDKLLESVTSRCLLSTTDSPDDPAVRLYLSAGWWKLGVLRPGVQVMGRLAA